jgi:hypothetical protein
MEITLSDIWGDAGFLIGLQIAAFAWRVSRELNMIINFQLEKREELILKFSNKFLSFLESIKIIPKELLIKRYEVCVAIEPIAKKLGIDLRMVEDIPALEYAQRTMKHFI